MSMRMKVSEWREKLVATGFQNAGDFDDATVMHILFSKSAEKKKLLKWLAKREWLPEMPSSSSTDLKDEDLQKVISSWLHIEEHDVPRFIDGSLNRDEQAKIWKSIFYESNIKGKCTEESKQERIRFLLNDVTKVALTPEVLVSLGYSELPEYEDDYMSQAAKALEAAENVLNMELPIAAVNSTPVSLPTPSELIEKLESVTMNVDLSEDPRLKRADIQHLVGTLEKLKMMGRLGVSSTK